MKTNISINMMFYDLTSMAQNLYMCLQAGFDLEKSPYVNTFLQEDGDWITLFEVSKEDMNYMLNQQET